MHVTIAGGTWGVLPIILRSQNWSVQSILLATHPWIMFLLVADVVVVIVFVVFLLTDPYFHLRSWLISPEFHLNQYVCIYQPPKVSILSNPHPPMSTRPCRLWCLSNYAQRCSLSGDFLLLCVFIDFWDFHFNWWFILMTLHGSFPYF